MTEDLFGPIDKEIPDPAKTPETPAFAKFWEVYPRKRSKGQARKAWEKLTKGMTKEEEQAFSAELRRAIQAQNEHRNKLKGTGEHIPDWKYPATWLNGYCWEDELEDIGSTAWKPEIQPCATEGCEEDALGPHFKLCAYHTSMTTFSRYDTNVTANDLREYLIKTDVRRRKGESMEDWVLRMRAFIKKRAGAIGG